MGDPSQALNGPVSRWRTHRRRHFLALLLAGSVGSAFISRRYLYSSIQVVGRSMEPTLRDGERRVVNRWAHRVFGFRRGDLVVLEEPTTKLQVVKRLIGLPGDAVRLAADGVYVNDLRLQEPYLAQDTYTHSRSMGTRSMRLSKDAFFVLGDNRLTSLDSRWYGPVPHSHLLGTVSP